jgi:hypothetical protein
LEFQLIDLYLAYQLSNLLFPLSCHKTSMGSRHSSPHIQGLACYHYQCYRIESTSWGLPYALRVFSSRRKSSLGFEFPPTSQPVIRQCGQGDLTPRLAVC